jgi:alpha-ketoglutarate-dependent taurine dioxygenase
MKNFIAALEGVRDVTLSPNYPRQAPELQAERQRDYPKVLHPVVRVHAESGRKGLFVGGFLRHFVGFTEDASQPIIDDLKRHATS